MKPTVLISLLLGGILTAGAAPAFRAVEIDRAVEIGYGLAIADVNGDGKLDVLLADKQTVVWYQNPDWQKHVIAERLTAADHVCIAAADIDGDGKAEVAMGAGWNPGDTLTSGAVFYLRAPADRRQKWDPIPLHHEPTTHRMRWIQASASGYDLVVLPLHGRGNQNAQGAGVRILAYQMPSDPKQPWNSDLIDDSLHLTHNFDPVQWDADPAHELLVAAKEGLFLFDRQEGKWQKTQLAGQRPGETSFTGAGEVRMGKLPGGQRFLGAIEPMHGNQVVIYTAPEPKDDSPLWRRRVLDDTLADGHAVVCADFMQAGHDQLAAGWRAMGKPQARVGIRLYAPLDAQGRNWQTALIDDNGMACEDLAAADLDGDGRVDLIAAGRATRNVKIYFNETPGPAKRSGE